MILLVAEDEALVALVLELELRGAGHEVLGPAATPEEALALVERTRPELALIDINLAVSVVWAARWARLTRTWQRPIARRRAACVLRRALAFRPACSEGLAGLHGPAPPNPLCLVQ